jgi:hypothetical protein
LFANQRKLAKDCQKKKKKKTEQNEAGKLYFAFTPKTKEMMDGNSQQKFV